MIKLCFVCYTDRMASLTVRYTPYLIAIGKVVLVFRLALGCVLLRCGAVAAM